MDSRCAHPTTRKLLITPGRAGGAPGHLALVRGETRGLWATTQRFVLFLASLFYGLAVRVRNLLYDHAWLRTQRAAVPVVSVGNLSVGGTGKTPCVEYVAGFYRDLDLRVAILSRGYGAEGGRNDKPCCSKTICPTCPICRGPTAWPWRVSPSSRIGQARYWSARTTASSIVGWPRPRCRPSSTPLAPGVTAGLLPVACSANRAVGCVEPASWC